MARSLYGDLASYFAPEEDGLTRRRMMQVSIAAGAAMLLSSSGLAAARRRPDGELPVAAPKRVVVIGAGLAGLSCASQLRHAGYEVQVLDAHDRCGGRVMTYTESEHNELIPGRVLEAGAEFIGSNHPLWLAFADGFGLKLSEVKRPNDPPPSVIIAGKKLDPAAAAKLYEDMTKAFSKLTAMAANVDADKPWTTPDAEKLDHQTLQSWIDGLDADDLVKKACRISLTSQNGVDPDAASLLAQLVRIKGGGLERYWTSSERFRCEAGNVMLAATLLLKVGVERFSMPSVVSAVTLNKSGTITVESADTMKIECDDVVLAIPPGAISGIRFSPALPADCRPQMGLAAKYLAYMRRRFWAENKISPITLSDGPVQRTWDATDAQVGDNDVCLAATASGPQATRILNLPPESVDAEFGKLLGAEFEGYDKNFVSGSMYDWVRDPNVRGSASFPAPGQVTKCGPVLEKGGFEFEGAARLHFAGEHTCFKFGGTMEGALQSGVETARKIAVRDGAK